MKFFYSAKRTLWWSLRQVFVVNVDHSANVFHPPMIC